MNLTKLQKIVMLLTWYTTPRPEELVRPEWEAFTKGRLIPPEDETILTYFAWIINGIDEKFLNWAALADFADQMAHAFGVAIDEQFPENPE